MLNRGPAIFDEDQSSATRAGPTHQGTCRVSLLADFISVTGPESGMNNRSKHLRVALICALFFLGGLSVTSHASASVTARIDLSQQRMYVSMNGNPRYAWRVSTGRKGYRTPTGNYSPWLLKRMHYSTKYNGSRMPHSIFFRGGYAIHGTYERHSLGRPASHGCVRLHPSNAATLFALVQRHGAGQTRIIIRF